MAPSCYHTYISPTANSLSTVSCIPMVELSCRCATLGIIYHKPLSHLITWFKLSPGRNNLLHPVSFFDGISYLIPNFKGAAAEVWEWRSNYIQHFTEYVITFPCLNLVVTCAAHTITWLARMIRVAIPLIEIHFFLFHFRFSSGQVISWVMFFSDKNTFFIICVT